MFIIGLLSTLSGGETCSDMALYGRLKEYFLRRFLTLRHGILGHDAFSDLFNALDLVPAIKGKFLLSINDTPEIRAIFAAFDIEDAETPYSIAKTSAKKVGELIISGGRRNG